jgi:hypothetical protein
MGKYSKEKYHSLMITFTIITSNFVMHQQHETKIHMQNLDQSVRGNSKTYLFLFTQASIVPSSFNLFHWR